MKQKKPVTGKEKDEAAKRRERQLKKSLHIAGEVFSSIFKVLLSVVLVIMITTTIVGGDGHLCGQGSGPYDEHRPGSAYSGLYELFV